MAIIIDYEMKKIQSMTKTTLKFVYRQQSFEF